VLLTYEQQSISNYTDYSSSGIHGITEPVFAYYGGYHGFAYHGALGYHRGFGYHGFGYHRGFGYHGFGYHTGFPGEFGFPGEIHYQSGG